MSGRPSDVDPFVVYDAAYVLGALSPEDRAAYEAHLPTCEDCSRAVRELAGVPGLLAQVPVSVAVGEPTSAPDPADDGTSDGPSAPRTLLDGLVAHAEDRSRRRRRRRRLWAGVVTAVAASMLVAVAVGQAVRGEGPSPQDGPVESAGPAPGDLARETVALRGTREGPLSVTAHLRSVAWGTSIELDCSYQAAGRDGGPEGPYARPPTYRLVVVAADGRTEDLGSWEAVPDRVVTVPAATALPRGALRAIEVRTAGGTTLLRAEV